MNRPAPPSGWPTQPLRLQRATGCPIQASFGLSGVVEVVHTTTESQKRHPYPLCRRLERSRRAATKKCFGCPSLPSFGKGGMTDARVFRAFAVAGKTLADLHVNYESQPETARAWKLDSLLVPTIHSSLIESGISLFVSFVPFVVDNPHPWNATLPITVYRLPFPRGHLLSSATLYRAPALPCPT